MRDVHAGRPRGTSTASLQQSLLCLLSATFTRPVGGSRKARLHPEAPGWETAD